MSGWPSLSIPGVVLLLAVASSLGVAAAALGRRTRSRQHWSFGLGMLGLATESATSLVLLTWTETPEARLAWLQAAQVTALLLLIPWGFFVVGLTDPGAPRSPATRLALGATSVLMLATAGAVATVSPFEFSDIPGPFYAAQLSAVGRLGIIAQLLTTAAILGGLESSLRTSRGTTRWRIKYLLLGLGGVFLARFFFLSQLLLFHVLLSAQVTAAGVTLLAGTATLGASLARDRRLGSDLTVSRQVLFRSAVVGVLGLYLFAVGGLGWLFNRLGISEELLWGSLVVFVSALALAVVLLSESVRWRVKRFIALNFYRSKYDYRDQWGRFTRRLGSLLSLEELAPELLAAVTEAAGARRGVLYLLETRDGRYHRTIVLEMGGVPAFLETDDPLVVLCRESPRPVVRDGSAPRPSLDSGGADTLALLGEGAVVVPLRWHGTLTGLMLIGPERTGAAYTLEDLEFLSTVGEQAAGTIVTARLSERLAQAREFEAFHRLTSFLIHDLKNSISALSLLSQNALAHFDDPEFQRDAVRTLSTTVERMKTLLARLSTSPEAASFRLQPVDIAALTLEATRAIGGGARVNLVKDLAPVAPVQGDPDALLRVIQNLVTNAVEAVEGEGSVTVQTYEETGWAVCVVSDTGKGMSPDFLKKSLFTAFRSTKKGGWGIGLYQAKGIVEAHEGTIEVTSQEGKGTTFRVKLPIEPRRGGVSGS